MQKLNQVIAVEKGVKAKVKADQTQVYQANDKPQLFEGFQKTYNPVREDGEKLPPENKRVQFNALELVREVGNRVTELLDITATKDFANCNAKADVVVDDVVVVKGAPVTFLLFLEKEVTDMRTFLAKLPTLDPAEEWALDAGSGFYRTPATQSIKTKKEQRPLVMYPATPAHPAQTQLITEDITVGTWTTTKLSGAVPDRVRKALVSRAEQLLNAIKKAREEANGVEAPVRNVGAAIMTWLVQGKEG